MLTCDQALELISARLDDMITPEESAALEEHLARCPDCRALLADFEAMQAVLPAALEADPPAGLQEDIMAAVRAAKLTPLPRQKPVRRFHPRRWASLAAVLAVVLVGAGVLRQWQPIPSSGGSTGTADSALTAQYDGASGAAAAPAGDGASGAAQDTADAPLPSSAAPQADGDAQSAAPAEQAAGSAPESGKTARAEESQTSAGPALYNSLDGSGESASSRDLQPEAAAGGEPQNAPVLATPAPAAGTLSGENGADPAAGQGEGPYCGVLTLPAQSGLDLSAYPCTQTEEETRYLLPAADFAALAAQAARLEGSVLEQEGDDIDPAAQTGLVIVPLQS